MPGPILNAKSEVIPLPFRIPSNAFLATPETLPVEIQRYVMAGDQWSLWTGFREQDLLPLFDCDKMVQYKPNNHQSWKAGRVDVSGFEHKFAISPSGRPEHGYLHWRGDVIELGPGWESHAADIYWAVARALTRFFNHCDLPENDQMVVMALDAMMRSHGRA